VISDVVIPTILATSLSTRNLLSLTKSKHLCLSNTGTWHGTFLFSNCIVNVTVTVAILDSVMLCDRVLVTVVVIMLPCLTVGM